MFVAVSKSRGIEYVFIRDYRTDPDGRRRQVTVKSLGRKDALMAQDPDFLTTANAPSGNDHIFG